MRILNQSPNFLSSKRNTNIRKDEEGSILLKIIAVSIPVLGLVISQMQINSLERKLQKIPLPQELRPKSLKGIEMSPFITPEQRISFILRGAEITNLEADYYKASAVNSLFTIAVVILAIAIKIIPFIFGSFIIGAFCLSAFTFAIAYKTHLSHARVFNEAI